MHHLKDWAPPEITQLLPKGYPSQDAYIPTHTWGDIHRVHSETSITIYCRSATVFYFVCFLIAVDTVHCLFCFTDAAMARLILL